MKQADPLVVVSVPDGPNMLVSARGEVDVVTAPVFAESLTGGHSFRVDLSEVSFLDSAGVRVLLTAYERVLCDGGSFSVVAASRPVRRVLAITGVATVLGLSADEPTDASESHV